jgi:uncharacterized repeat protein (TIGR03806 family)
MRTSLPLSISIGLLLCWVGAALAQPFGLTQRVAVSGVRIPLDDPGAPGTVRIGRAFPNLSFSLPLFVTHAPDGSNRLFVVEKGGKIRVFENTETVASSTDFLDLSAKVQTDGEQGLLGLAFAPDFASTGYFYVYYSALSGIRRSVIARFRVSADPNRADPNSESTVIEVPQYSASNHKGGMLAFGADGMLYIALGDGGGAGDPAATGQNCSDMLGNILRIDPRGATPYRIPADNPYAGNGNFGCGTLNSAPSRTCGLQGYAAGQICKELYAVGLRNPWRFSFDRVSGALWLGDVGQGTWEEVNLVRSGDNLGWRLFEGSADYNNPSSVPLSSTRAPILSYPRGAGGGSSITGGYVYRGSSIPALYGKYIYGDYSSGNVWALDYNGSAVVSNVRIGGSGSVVSFGEDKDGELYTAVIGSGAIYRIRPAAPSTSSIPTQLSQTGLFSDLANLQITSGGIEYGVQAPLWSDAAAKRRWILLPGSSQIQFNPTQAYSFPIGTALVKHFELTLANGLSRRLETRVFFLHNQGWAGYTYKWRADGSDADLLQDAQVEAYTVQDSSAPGGQRLQEWYYPSRTDCMGCHTASAGRILGVRTRQLNGNFNYPTTIDNQLRAWNHIGLFSADIGSATSYDSYPQYTDGSKPVAQRARAYLASNCAHCHNPAEPRPGVVDLRYESALAQTGMLERPAYGDLGLSDAYRIKPGVPSSSVLLERMRRLDSNRMPPLASSVVDSSAISLLNSWIISLSAPLAPAAPQRLRLLP